MALKRIQNEITDWLCSKKRVLYLLIGLAAVLLYETARAFYRPFIYSQAINDFHVADTLGNSLGTVATVFFFVSLLGKTTAQERFLIRTVTMGVFVYELAHPLLGKPIDHWDLLATVLAGFFCEGLYGVIHRRLEPTGSNGVTPI